MAIPKDRSFNLIVIGGGIAGLSAIRGALTLGIDRIALVEKRSRLGGECLLDACIPGKTLSTAARLLKTIQHQAPQYGITGSQLQFDLQTLLAKKDAIIESAVESDIFNAEQVELIQGEAAFISKRELRLNHNHVIRGEKIFIATGTEPFIPPIKGLHDTGFLLFSDITHMKRLPKSLIIIGGGVIGVEFSQALPKTKRRSIS